MNPLARLGISARRGFGKVVPDPFVIAIFLTLFVAAAALVRGHAPVAVVNDWHAGLWSLLSFGMQATLMLVLGTALARAPAIRRLIAALVGRAGNGRTLVALTAALSISLSLINWSLGLIGGALFAHAAGQQARARGWSLHYPLLCAAGYSGLMTWHGGLSGTAPLKATTVKDMNEVLGPELAARVGTIPLDASLLSPLNLWVSGGLWLLGPLMFWLLTPREGSDPDPSPAPGLDPLHVEPVTEGEPDAGTLERSAWVSWLLAAPLVLALVLTLRDRGIARLDVNTVNLALWGGGMVLHGRPDRFLRACAEGVAGCAGIVIQFPLYGGIMAIMKGSGLSAWLGAVFAGAGSSLLLPASFASAGLLNLFVPSGGGQWAVQGSILMEAALRTDVAPSAVMMAMAYGDQWTNMLQPFWALPLLAITGVRARDIVGYCVVWMGVGGLWILGALALA